MKTREQQKADDDRGWAELFTKLLNDSQKTDYVVEDAAQKPGWADIDAFATSTSGQQPLYIQFVWDRKPVQDFATIYKSYRAKMFEGGNREVVVHIRAKYNHYKSRDKYFGDHTLVVQVPSIIEGDAEYRYSKAMRDECATFGFKAVYLLSPLLRGSNETVPAAICRLA